MGVTAQQTSSGPGPGEAGCLPAPNLHLGPWIRISHPLYAPSREPRRGCRKRGCRARARGWALASRPFPEGAAPSQHRPAGLPRARPSRISRRRALQPFPGGSGRRGPGALGAAMGSACPRPGLGTHSSALHAPELFLGKGVDEAPAQPLSFSWHFPVNPPGVRVGHFQRPGPALGPGLRPAPSLQSAVQSRWGWKGSGLLPSQVSSSAWASVPTTWTSLETHPSKHQINLN